MNDLQSPELLLKVADAVSADFSADFCLTLARHLAEALKADHALVAELLPTQPARARTLGVVADGKPIAGFEFDLAGSPCAGLLNGKPCAWERGVQERFPQDRLLADWGVQAYVGTPLVGVGDRVLGLMAVTFRHTLVQPEVALSLLGMFAKCAAAELERSRTERSHRLLMAAVEQAGEGFFITDAEGTIEYVNAAFGRMIGYTAAELVGQTPRLLRRGEHHAGFFHEMWSVIRSGNPWSGRVVNRHRDGSLLTEELTIAPVREGGVLDHFVALVRDVTEEVRLENQLRQSQKMEAMGRLASGVAHDFNNLLQAIHGFTTLAMEELPPREPAWESLDEVLQIVTRAGGLVRQLMVMSRQQPLQPEAVDLNGLLTGLMRMVERVLGEDLELRVSLAPGLPAAQADAAQLEQVVLNLCVNARDAMPQGGVLSVSTGETMLDAQACRRWPWLHSGRFVSLTIRDTGIGMTPEVKERIFEPFFTTKPAGQGTGLGLATVYGIVKQHEGVVTVESEPGCGSTFIVCLPVATTIARPIAPVAEPASIAGGSETILLAEDEEPVRRLAVRFLERAGYSVLVAVDGQQALELFQANRGAIGAAVLDLVMPRKSGRAVFEALRAERPELPVIFSTGYAPHQLNSPLCPDLGADVILKPYDPQELLTRLRHLLDRAAARQSA